MNPLSALFNNPSIKKLAFSGVVKLMTEEKLQAIVVKPAPGKTDGPIPDCDVQLYKIPILIFEEGTIGISSADYDKLEEEMRLLAMYRQYQGVIPDKAIAQDVAEVKSIIEKYFKSKYGNIPVQAEGSGDPDAYTTGAEYGETGTQ